MTPTREPTGDAIAGVNVSVLRGELSAPPDLRTLPSGTRLATFGLRAPSPGGPDRPPKGRRAKASNGAEPTAAPTATSVPVAMWEPPAWVEQLGAGDAVLVVGAVRRRFFRAAGGVTGSRVEVQAEAVARAGDRRRAQALERRIARSLEALA